MYWRKAQLLFLIVSAIISGCTRDISTNYHERAEYNAETLTTIPHFSSSEHSGSVSRDISHYASEIKTAVEKQFYMSGKYSGKVCSVKITMAPNGVVLDARKENGDPALCREALNAVRNADIPPPPSSEIYNVFRNGVLDFKP
ncbi:cell envelope integrity protein TolA [Escherichia coli]|uniref:cell envelope integrity protein TolA n=1 Tax=Escherichia coli TaxID=562 RepID=UPI00164FA9AF|nr:cell envelope integrity protein TolA [Escherichia coli]MBC6573308.1 cell envelope integrity protein TolA [Escherichia coli]